MRRLSRRKPLGQLLVEKGVITPQQLRDALEKQRDTTLRIGEVVINLGYADRRAIYEALAEQLGVPFLDLRRADVDPDIAMLIPRDMATKYKCIPIGRGDGTIKVAMSEPGDVMAEDDLRSVLQVPVEHILADPEAVKSAIESVFGESRGGPAPPSGAAGGDGGMGGFGEVAALADSIRESGLLGVSDARSDEYSEGQVVTDRVADLAEEAPIIRMAKVLIQRAIQERASDIHIEPERERVRVRYRVDGVLHEVMGLPRYVHAPLLSRVKIMASMNIAEHRVPQDGRIHVRHQGREYDLRVSVIPTTNGEKAVMRILDVQSVMIGLESLGFEHDHSAIVERLIRQPNGMILSTGPTGSGKTTTQYAILNTINNVEINIITVEDPVEYQLDGIYQVHVNRKAGLTFAVALKYFLRQDPDVILVGEIRDLETAEIAIQASLTGHLVLSTLHTNDAPSTVTRLVDMGIEPFLISSSVIASISQRLARRVCTACKEPYKPRNDFLLGFGFDPDAPENRDQVFYHGRGCERCRHTGYFGRVAIFELMEMNAELAELVAKRATHGQIREAAMANGMVNLAMDGFRKALRGVTTVEDLTRVVATAGQYAT
jgi:type IV pilus assembly protein PilB